MDDKLPIPKAITVLNKNLSEIGRVEEWAIRMGYNQSKKFSRYFHRYYKVRPQKVINEIRLKSIIKHLREQDNLSNFDIAQQHSLPDEKALNNFTNYHLRCSPTEIKTMSDATLKKGLENFGSKFAE